MSTAESFDSLLHTPAFLCGLLGILAIPLLVAVARVIGSRNAELRFEQLKAKKPRIDELVELLKAEHNSGSDLLVVRLCRGRIKPLSRLILTSDDATCKEAAARWKSLAPRHTLDYTGRSLEYRRSDAYKAMRKAHIKLGLTTGAIGSALVSPGILAYFLLPMTWLGVVLFILAWLGAGLIAWGLGVAVTGRYELGVTHYSCPHCRASFAFPPMVGEQMKCKRCDQWVRG